MDRALLETLETPCVVIDMEKVRRNIAEMQRQADECHVALRPHVKTHKMPLFTRMQLEAGAKGITCCKVSEAEVMFAGGAEDIFIAYPQIGARRIARVLELNRKIPRLIIAVDSREGAEMLSAAAAADGQTVEVRMEVDTGAGRTGVVRDQAVALARHIAALPGLKLTGIYTFKSLVYRDKVTTDNALAGQEEGDLLAEVAAAIRDAGVPLAEISGGSSPTGYDVAKTGKVTEIRPGTYIFKDNFLIRENVATDDDVAVRMYATVVSTPREDYAVIDGGSKTFPMDVLFGQPPYYYDTYVRVMGRDDLKLVRMNEEHGILVGTTGHTGLHVGDILELMPMHVCPAINFQNSVYLLEDGRLRKEPVAARGTLF